MFVGNENWWSAPNLYTKITLDEKLVVWLMQIVLKKHRSCGIIEGHV